MQTTPMILRFLQIHQLKNESLLYNLGHPATCIGLYVNWDKIDYTHFKQDGSSTVTYQMDGCNITRHK